MCLELVLACALGGLWLPMRDGAASKGQAHLTIDDRAGCGTSVEALWDRIEARTLGATDENLLASVHLEAQEHGVAVTIRIRSSTRLNGSKTLTTPACEEAEDALVTLVAMAFSRAEAPEVPAQPFADRAPITLVSRNIERDAPLVHDSATSDPAETERPTRWVVQGEVGMDLPLGGLSVRRAVWGVGGIGRWGQHSFGVGGQLFQTVQVEDESSGAQNELQYFSSRVDTFGLNTAYCRSLEGAAWLNFCGGAQVNFWRTAFSDGDGPPGSTEVKHEWSVDSLLGARISKNWKFLQPHARLAVRLPIYGHPDEYKNLALVGSMGIGVIF